MDLQLGRLSKIFEVKFTFGGSIVRVQGLPGLGLKVTVCFAHSSLLYFFWRIALFFSFGFCCFVSIFDWI